MPMKLVGVSVTTAVPVHHAKTLRWYLAPMHHRQHRQLTSANSWRGMPNQRGGVHTKHDEEQQPCLSPGGSVR